MAVIPGVEDRFEIRERLGAGSFGVVYEAFDLHRNRLVALKVLERPSPETVARFKREFRYLAEIRHPNLASMYELLVLEERWILSMELVRGSDLLEHLAFGELQHSFFEEPKTEVDELDEDATLVLRPPRKANPERQLSPIYVEHVRNAFRQLAVALAVLHSRGVVHRDLKPSNIMITPDGRVVLLDFGLVLDTSGEDTLDRKLVVGTPGYMSPEQIRASPATAASDWYSFGVLLYQALTGTLPFIGATPMEVLELQMRGDAPLASSVVRGIPEELDALVAHLIESDPAARPGDMEVLSKLGIEHFDPFETERSRLRSSDLAGRRSELRSLLTQLDRSHSGLPQVIFLHGSPGVGKSAILDCLLNEIRERDDAFILGGRCHAWESVPMNAVDALVDSLSRQLRRDRSAADEELLGRAVSATRLFPALAYEIQGSGVDETISLPSGKRLMMRAASELRALLFSLAQERRIVMVLDDAQWGDFQSAQFLQRLLEPGGGPPMVLILSYRSEDWRTSLLLQGLQGGELRRHDLHIGDLSRNATARILRDQGCGSGKRLVDAVFAQTEGNPALIRMVADYLQSSTQEPYFARAVESLVMRLSAAAHRLFAFLLSSDEPVAEEEAEERLELFEMDEPLRTLSSARLIRTRRTGDLREIDLYHPRMRKVLRSG